jgi:hypothetical protein
VAGDTAFVEEQLVDVCVLEDANQRCEQRGQAVAVAEAIGESSSWIIDGGTLSNFPVWLFDVDPAEGAGEPKRLTFGFTLRGGRGVGGQVNHIIEHLDSLGVD